MSCCESTPVSTRNDGECSSCRTRGMQVAVITVKALMTGDALRRGVPQAPRFCASAECSVVYFDDVSDRKVEEGELTVRVFAKHPHELSALGCYCFGYTREAIEIAAVRQTTRVSDA